MILNNWTKLPYLDKSELNNIQTQKFLYLLCQLVPYSPFYRKYYQSIDLTKFKSISDIIRLPFTEKKDLLPTDKNPNKTKDFILQPSTELIMQTIPWSKKLNLLIKKTFGSDPKQKFEYEFRPVHLHFTTGRSSIQIPFLYSKKDLDVLSETGHRLLDIIGAHKEDVAINGFPYAPHLAFWFTTYACRDFGLLCFHTGGGKILGTQRIIDAVEKLQPTILVFIPSYAYHLLNVAAEQSKNFSSIKKIVFGGERVSPGLKNKVKEMLGKLGATDVTVYSTYASTESKTAWVQCHENSGYHLYPDLEYIEIVDEEGNPVPEGNPGEIVYTSLDWRASVVIRYKTGDFCQGLRTSEPCGYCGRTVPRLHYDIERKSDKIELNLTKIKGELVNLNSFYKLIHEVSGVDEWQVEIGKVNNDPFELDEINLHVSLKDKSKEQLVTSDLKKVIQSEMSINPKIIIQPKEKIIDMLGIERELKEKRIVDLRKSR